VSINLNKRTNVFSSIRVKKLMISNLKVDVMRIPITYRDKTALKIAIVYALAAAAWILLSDFLILPFIEYGIFPILSIIKGWMFVIVTATILYFLVSRALWRIYQSEAQMQLLVNVVPDGVFLYEVDSIGKMGELVDVNEAAVRQTGYTREELLQKSAKDLVKPDYWPRLGEATETLMRDGRVVFEIEIIRKDGSVLPIEVSSRIVRVRDQLIGVSVVRDITMRKRVEEERREAALAAERDKRRFYRETVLAVSGGKFEICDPEDTACRPSEPGFIAEFSGAEQVSAIRRAVMEYCRNQGLSEDRVSDFELAVGEALANAVKHAGGGRVEAGRKGVAIWVAVIDQGSGIDTFALPRVAFMPGYTTKPSMGLGYTLILDVSDHVSLSTGPTGTTVVLEKRLKPVSEIERSISTFTGIK